MRPLSIEHVEGLNYIARFASGATVAFTQTREFPHSGHGVYCDELHAPLYAHALALFPAESRSASAIDVGCGSGYGTDMLRLGGYQATGVDRGAAYEYALHRADECRIVEGDLESKIIEPDGPTYDLGVMIEVVEHLHDPRPTLESMASRCRRMYLTTPDAEVSTGPSPFHVKEFTKAELLELLTDCGWRDVEYVEAPKHHFQGTLAVIAKGGPE